ncbi:TetR family transcriptional regulator [Arachnia propionica]|uniref:TetR/AcrR family transcriptional regulator n=1 Tax=Arachnia propionica TaxID=1750 RepID=UPI0030D08350
MPGGSKSERTKLRIQQAAARLFASRSFETVSTRAIAKEAGVDAALIHHYFGSKEGLFQAVLNAAIRPEQLEALVVSESPEDWGRQLVRAADKVWTSPAAPALKAVVRRVLVGHEGMLREFVTRSLLNRFLSHIKGPETERRLRASLIGSQMSGLVIARHIVGIEPLASLSSDEVADLIGPVLQHYITGSLHKDSL